MSRFQMFELKKYKWTLPNQIKIGKIDKLNSWDYKTFGIPLHLELMYFLE